MIKNIFLITKISTKGIINSIDIIDKKKRKVNKKSMYFWLMIIISITAAIISYKILLELGRINKKEIFLNIYISILTIIMFFQTVILSINVYYFSKDIEYFLPMPIKPIEIFLGKFNTILTVLYATETIFALIPLVLYGLNTIASPPYYITMFIVLMILPIFPVLVISLIMNLFMKFNKFIKNKDLFQIIVVLLIIGIIFISEYFFVKSQLLNQENITETMISVNNIADKLNQGLIVIKPLINLMLNNNYLSNLMFVLGVYFILIVILLFNVKRTYIKQILQITNRGVKNKLKKVNLYEDCKEKNTLKAYIINECKNIYKNVNFMLQGIFPSISIILCIIFISISVKINLIEKQEEIKQFLANLELNLEGICVLLGISQIINSFINLSITAISRHGKNAIFMKYIPINIHKQILLKNIPQMLIGWIYSIIIFVIAKIIFVKIPFIHLILMIINALIINVLNSYLMLVVDIKRPILNWDNEMEVFKQNGNKLFQYVFTISVVLILMYIVNIFKEINLLLSQGVIFIIFSMMLFLLDKYVQKQLKQHKLLNKII